jgi:lipopolysaccharide O-acetyltransferase
MTHHYKPGKFEMYGLFGAIRLALNLIMTKLYIPSARLVRFPIDIRGKKYIDFGKKLTIGKGCRIEAYPYLHQGKIIKLGDNVEINDYVHITGVNKVVIGNNVLMASKIFISDTNHGSYKGDENDSLPESITGKRKVIGLPVSIEDNVWLGESVSVLSGVTIGRCSVIGANSVVSKDIPAYTIAVGNPAKLVKSFNFDTNKWEKIK